MNNEELMALLKQIMNQANQMNIQSKQNEEQAIAIYEMHKNSIEVSKSMAVFEDKMLGFGEKMDKLEFKIDNYIFLSPAECSEMSDLVRKIAIKISDRLDYINYYPSAKNFGDIVKRVLIGIRSMTKGKFKAHRWYMIKHTDYDEAMEYISGLGFSEFMEYRSRIVNKNKKYENKTNLKVVK